MAVSVQQSTARLDPRVQDTIVLFDREFKDNVTNPIGEKYGFATFKIAAGGTKSGVILPFFSGLTLGSLNLLGMPADAYKTSVEVEIELLDAKKNVVGRYTAIGTATSLVAFYYGYTNENASRMSNILAVKRALTEIKDHIKNDHADLNKKLLGVGVVQ
jgi:hypothetical protein